MSIEYMLDLSCEAKRALGTDVLARLLKNSHQSRAILAMVRAQGDLRDPSEIRIRSVRIHPEGPVESETTVAELATADATLAPWQASCAGCAARLSDAAFSCYGAIPYPIEVATEEWLLSLLPDHLESTAGGFMLRAVSELGYDGEPVTEGRERKEMFETSDTLAIRWGYEDDTEVFSVTTDQLLQMMFHVGPIQPAHATLLSLILGSIPHDVDVGRFRDATDDRALLRTLFERPSRAGGGYWHSAIGAHGCSAQIDAMRAFLGALRLSATLGVRILIDA